MQSRRNQRPTPASKPARPAAQSPAKTPPPQGKRVWVFRAVAAIATPLLFLLVLEVSLRLAGFGHSAAFLLPAKLGHQDIYIQNDRFAWRFFGAQAARQPQPLLISKIKPANTVRIFVFGESAAFGDPQPAFGLPRMLQAVLSDRHPGTHFEVINAAMTAINSHAILPIARDCAPRDGDVWVIYMGNNEVVGPFGAGTVFGSKTANLAFIRGTLALKASRTGQWLGSLLQAARKAPAATNEWGGMMMFVGNQVREDDPRMAGVYAHFERNLADIIRAGERSGAKIVVSTVASNLKDCGPFGSLHTPGLKDDALAEWERLYQLGETARKNGRYAEAIGNFQQAEKLDGTFADLQFQWGHCCLALGQDADALRRFTLARDQDTLRFRADTRINEIIRHAANGHERDGIRFVDAEAALRRESPHGLTGAEFLHEHVHPNFAGNYQLARAIADEAEKVLPEAVQRRAVPARPWASAADCAKRLGWSELDQSAADAEILGRFRDPPFTAQLTHDEQTARLNQELEKLAGASQLPGLSEAEMRCEEAATNAPGDWIIQQNLAQIRQRIGDFKGAEIAWRAVVKLMPYSPEGWQGLGQALDQLNHPDDAVAALNEALKLDPNSAITLNSLAQILAHQGKNAEARRRYEEVLKLKPYWGPAHLGLGKIQEAAGQTNEANAHFREALKNRVISPASFRALGTLSFEKGWFSEAATNFMDALRLNPSDPGTHLNLGITFTRLERNAEARQEFAEAARLDPNIAEAHFRLGFELGRQGDTAGASAQFAEAVRLKPEMLEAHLNLGIALRNQGRPAEALQQFQEVLKREPANAVALKFSRDLTAAK